MDFEKSFVESIFDSSFFYQVLQRMRFLKCPSHAKGLNTQPSLSKALMCPCQTEVRNSLISELKKIAKADNILK